MILKDLAEFANLSIAITVQRSVLHEAIMAVEQARKEYEEALAEEKAAAGFPALPGGLSELFEASQGQSSNNEPVGFSSKAGAGAGAGY